MEVGAGSRRSHHPGGDVVVKEDADGSSGSQEVHHDLKVVVDDNYDMGRTSLEPNSVVSSLSQKDQDTRLESTRTKMGEVREENERLKMYLDRIMKEYQTLQMKFHDIVQPEANNNDKNIHDDEETEEENQLVSLSLGRVPSDSRKEDKSKVSESSSTKQSLSLGLDSKPLTSKLAVTENSSDPSPANSLEELKDGAGEIWPPSKVLTNTKRSGEDEVSAQTPAAKKARVSVRARCDTPTMNDGCQWRKYGQKISKGNPCPRAYYRCTVAPNCPVRKQVQRCAQDMSILITTYEGNHNHPLSMSATAMASTTSAAASMLLSGSSSTTTTSAQLHGLNLSLSDPNNSHKSNLFLHNTSISSSYPPSFPTITLDLTTSNNLIPSSSSHQLTRFNSSYTQRHYPPTSLNFSSSEATAMDWGSGVLNYGSSTSTAHQQQYTNSRSQFGTLDYLGLGNGQPRNIYQSYMQQSNSNASTNPISNQHYNLPDTLAAATKAITADPAFQSVLAAALTSIIGGGSGGGAQGGGGGEKMKWGEVFPAGDAATSSASGCASSYLMNKSTAVANSQRPGGLMFLQPSLPFSTPKSTSTSPSETRDQNS